jgi:hypothetical protein
LISVLKRLLSGNVWEGCHAAARITPPPAARATRRHMALAPHPFGRAQRKDALSGRGLLRRLRRARRRRRAEPGRAGVPSRGGRPRWHEARPGIGRAGGDVEPRRHADGPRAAGSGLHQNILKHNETASISTASWEPYFIFAGDRTPTGRGLLRRLRVK